MSPSEHIRAIRRAADIMVRRPDYPELKRDVGQLAQTRFGAFTGELIPLNILVDYTREAGAEALQGLWKLLDRKHRKRFPRDPKQEYQALYMRERRLRLRKAVSLYEQIAGEHLSAQERKNFTAHQQAVWMARRDQLMQESGNVPLDQRNELSRMFWEEINDQLEAGLAGNQEAIAQFMKDH